MATLAGWMEDNEANLPVRLDGYDRQDSFVRALPNEDVCLWIKTIDNSRVVRHADPKVRNACWRFIGIASIVVLLVVGQLLPAAYRLLAGYQLNRLEKQHAELMDMRRTLQLDNAVLRSPENLEQLAKLHGMKPAPQRVHDIAPAGEESLALNRGAR